MHHTKSIGFHASLCIVIVAAASLNLAHSTPPKNFAELEWDHPHEAAEPDVTRGRALFTMCAGCHGRAAEGNENLHAPALTGLGAEYVRLELSLFRYGLRGNDRDKYGFAMIGVARALPGDRALRDVSAYINSLPIVPTGLDLYAGLRGRRLYESCAGCHGANGQGSQNAGAPVLRGRDYNYLVTQLRNFQSGIRGAEVADVGGQQMRQAVRILPDDNAIRDVVAYLTKAK